MRRTPLLPVAAIAAALALVLAGCSKEPGDAPTDQAGPLDEYIERAYGTGSDMSNDDTQAEVDQQNKRYKEIMAQCMIDQGFEYFPDDPGGMMAFAVSDDEVGQDGPQYGTLEYAKLYGYGMFNNPYMASETDAPEDEPTYTPTQTDKYLESMSESEREAYYIALQGEQPDWSSMTQEEMDEYQWQPGGCEAKAQQEAFGQDVADTGQEESPYAELEQAMNDMYTRIESDPRQGDLNAKWAACMADAGHSGYATPSDAENSVYEAMNAVTEELAQDPTWDGEIPADQKKELEELEMSRATADFSCREKVKYESERAKISLAIQQEFVDQHRSELEAWSQWMAQQNTPSSSGASDS